MSISLDSRIEPSRRWLAYVALIAIGFNLRGPLTCVPPVLDIIRADLGLTAPLAGLLTSIPVLCFGLLPPLLSPLIGRIGIDRAIHLALVGSALGMLVRPWGGMALLLGGSLLVGISLALGNIAALLVIARDFSRQVQTATGIYTAAMNIGAMLTIAATVPLARALGWRVALACWALLGVAGIAIWWLNLRGRPADPLSHPGAARAGDEAPSPSLLRRPMVWIITAAFAIHIFCYYALTAWLPVYLVESGTMSPRDAGFAASSFQVFSLTGALGLPLLARRFSLASLFIVIGLAWTATPLWLLLAPQQWYMWSPIGSFAHGGAFVLIFMLIVEHAQNLDDNRRISTLGQSVGYALAAIGPILMGWLHAVNGNWNAGLMLIAALTSLLILLGLATLRWGRRQVHGG